MGAVSEQRKRVVIVGASDTGQALALSLSTTWEVVLFEVNPERLAPLQMTARPAEAQLRLVAKDGTSLLNLREAGLDGAEWLIAVTERDDVNVEICRLVLTSERPPAAVAVVGSAEASMVEGLPSLLTPTNTPLWYACWKSPNCRKNSRCASSRPSPSTSSLVLPAPVMIACQVVGPPSARVPSNTPVSL